jgi:hypothetical protein
MTALYQWVWNIDGGFNWYAGVGGGVGNYSHDFNGDKYDTLYLLLEISVLNITLIFLC